MLCIQDTREINLYRHRNRISKDNYIGVTNASQCGLGFLIHPSLVMDAESFMPYGFSDIKIWNRGHEVTAKDRSHAKNMASKKQKESYKWIESSIKSKQALARAREVIIIQDREGDIYERFYIVPDEHTHLLIRAKTNPILSDQARLFEHLAQLPKQGDYQIVLEGDKRRAIKKRTATIEVPFSKVTISRNQYNDRSMPETKELMLLKPGRLQKEWKILSYGDCSLH